MILLLINFLHQFRKVLSETSTPYLYFISSARSSHGILSKLPMSVKAQIKQAKAYAST